MGLAATQVDVQKQVIVIDASETRNELLVLINRRSSRAKAFSIARRAACRFQDLRTGRARRARNGACAWPGRKILYLRCRENSSRSASSTKWITSTGKVFVDYLSRLKQQRIKAKLQKQASQDGLSRSARAASRPSPERVPLP